MAVFDIGNSFVANSYGFYIATCYGDTPPCGFRHSRTLSVSILVGLVVTLILLSLY